MRKPTHPEIDPRAISVPRNISLPQLQGDAEVLVIGTSHVFRSLVPLIASQLRALDITTLYIEANRDTTVYDHLEAGDPVTPDWLSREMGLASSEIDLVLAAQMVGMRVVGVDDHSARAVLHQSFDLTNPREVDAYLRAHSDLQAERNCIMAEGILRDREDRKGATSTPGTALFFGGDGHLKAQRTSDGTTIEGIGTQLRAAGVRARDVSVLGELQSIRHVSAGLHHALDADGFDRQSAFVIPTGNASVTAIHLAEHPVRPSTLETVHHGLVPLSDIEALIHMDLEDDDPNAAYLRGYAAVRALDGQAAAAHFAEGVRRGEPLLNLELARASLLNMRGDVAQPPSSEQTEEAITALVRAVEAGIPGAARISAGFLQTIGRRDEALALNRRADQEELARRDLWPRDRTDARRALRDQLPAESAGSGLLSQIRRRARRTLPPDDGRVHSPTTQPNPDDGAARPQLRPEQGAGRPSTIRRPDGSGRSF